MKKLISILFLSLFFMGWDMPDSYTSPNRTSFSNASNNSNLKYIPINSVAIQTLSVGQIMNKMNYPKIMNTDLMDYAFEEMRNNDVPRKIRGFIKDPYLMGIDLDQPIYSYIVPINKEKTYHEKPTQVLVNLYKELKKENLFNNRDIYKQILTKEECYSINNNLNKYVYISSSVKEDWSFSVNCNYSPEWDYEKRRYIENYYIDELLAESTSSMEHGYGKTIELWEDYYGGYDIYGYGHSGNNDFNANFTFGFIIPMKDLDLFELNVASVIDLIPDRHIDIKDGEINGFKYKLIQERGEFLHSETDYNIDRFIIAYNKDIILISMNTTGGSEEHSFSEMDLVSSIENKISNEFDINKPGLDEIHSFDTSVWIEASPDNPYLKGVYLEMIDEIIREIPDFDEDNFIQEQEEQLSKNMEIAPYFIAGINMNENDISISMKSLFSDTGKGYFKDHTSKILDRKIGKEIIASVPTNNMIAGMGYSIDLIELINFTINYENKLFNTNHFNNSLEELSSEIQIPVSEIKKIFPGNFLALLYDINLNRETVDFVLVGEIKDPNNFLISSLEKSHLSGNFPINIDKGYGSEVQLLLKEVAAASEMYEAMHGGQQTTLDKLESKAFIDVSDAQKRKWKVEISGDIFIATSTHGMKDGAGHKLRYDRSTGEFSGYGFNYNKNLNNSISYEKYKPIVVAKDERNPISLLIDDKFIYFGSKNVINDISRNSKYQININKIVNNRAENLNLFFSVNLDEAISLIPTDRDREAREVKSFLRGLGLGSLNLESMFNENYSEISGKIEINSSRQNPLEFIIFNLIPIMEDELLD